MIEIIRLPLRGAREPPMDLYELGLQVLALSFDFGVKGKLQHPKSAQAFIDSWFYCAVLRNNH